MKAKGLIAAIATAFLLTGLSDGAYAQKRVQINGAPGIVVAGSQSCDKLPKGARTFIEKHFKGVGVAKCEQYFAKNKYEVELANGVDIEFDNNGKIMEIDAPDNTCLAPSVVKDVVHGNAYRRLENDGLASRIESVEFDKRGRAVEVEVSMPEPNTYVFDINGNFIAISD